MALCHGHTQSEDRANCENPKGPHFYSGGLVGSPKRLHLWLPSMQHVHLDWCGVAMQEIFAVGK